MRAIVKISIAILAVSAVNIPAYAKDLQALKMEGKGLMMKFGKSLKGELVAAMKQGGPVKAIGVCRVKAPKIASQVSSGSWKVARSSHKLRNPSNGPDAFTRMVIKEFSKRQAAGEKANTLLKAKITEENGKKVFRMVKAIPTAKVCLKCHGGDNVKPQVVEKIAELYPNDKARGFKEGEMRGVFTLKKVLE